MPISITAPSGGGQTYGQALLGPVDHEVQLPLVLSGFTDDEIDADGYLKSGIPVTKAGTLVGNSPAFVYGVTIEPVRVAKNNSSDTIAALGTVDIGVCVIGAYIQDMGESNLGRSLTTNEVQGFDRAGSKIVLI